MDGLKAECEKLRTEIGESAEGIKALKGKIPFVGGEAEGEMHANIQLAYRHLQDARARLRYIIEA